jgi:hypothetical protein
MRSLVFVVALLCAAPALAQPEIAKATVTTNAPIFIQPGAQVPLRVAKVGTTLKVLQEEAEWLEVEFNDPQFGRRVGWVQKKLVQIFRPELEPIDLSVKELAAGANPAAPASPRQTPPQSPVSSAITRRRERGWIDVNIGAASAAQKSVTTEFNVDDGFGEFATYRVGYKAPTGAAFDFGGGVMFSDTIGLGILFAGTAHKSPADLDIRIPHPTAFNRFATDAAPTKGDLDRVEGAAHIQLMFKAPLDDDRVRVRLFGGPSYFRVEADAISNIRYLQTFNLLGFNEVDIDSYDTEKIEETAWGFHVGGDVTWFFSRVFGIGGFARLSRGEVTVEDSDIPADGPVDVKVGGFQGGLGLRFRF